MVPGALAGPGSCPTVLAMKTPIPWAVPRTPFTIAQVAPLGVTERRLRTALAEGRLTRLRQGVYVAADAVPSDPVGLHLVRALAEQVAAPGLVASHRTAALAHGVPLLGSDREAAGPVELTRDDAAGRRSERGARRTIHVGRLPDHHVTTLPSGLAVTTPVRTAVDLAACCALPEGLMALDAAARMTLADLCGSADPRHYGNARLRRAAVAPLVEAAGFLLVPGGTRRLAGALAMVDVRRESPLESYSCAHFHLAGLPEPVLQARVRSGGRTYRVDALWEAFGVVGEADGQGKYGDSAAFVEEKLREQDLVDRGLVVVRWVGREMFARPQVVVDRVSRALVSRGWGGGGVQPGR